LFQAGKQLIEPNLLLWWEKFVTICHVGVEQIAKERGEWQFE